MLPAFAQKLPQTCPIFAIFHFLKICHFEYPLGPLLWKIKNNFFFDFCLLRPIYLLEKYYVCDFYHFVSLNPFFHFSVFILNDAWCSLAASLKSLVTPLTKINALFTRYVSIINWNKPFKFRFRFRKRHHLRKKITN